MPASSGPPSQARWCFALAGFGASALGAARRRSRGCPGAGLGRLAQLVLDDLAHRIARQALQHQQPLRVFDKYSMILNELYHRSQAAYQDVSQDNSQPQLHNLRKTRLTLRQINKLRQRSLAR